jgi:hypothetical protein
MRAIEACRTPALGAQAVQCDRCGGNPKPIYDALFRAASETLLQFGRNPRWLGGELGATLVLHTWGQNLSQHIHVHCVVTGGALSPDGSRFRRGMEGASAEPRSPR